MKYRKALRRQEQRNDRDFKTIFHVAIATIVGGAALVWSGQLPLDPQSSLLSSAEARSDAR
ncbi:hypothetical protein ACFIOY_00340 [Bradyrhizobium sp. TZ2]